MKKIRLGGNKKRRLYRKVLVVNLLVDMELQSKLVVDMGLQRNRDRVKYNI